MVKISTLGPAGTFSELATKKFVQQKNEICDIRFFSSIKNVLHEIGYSCEIGVIPIENFSEGFIAEVLDELVERDLSIISEIILPIEFSFVSPMKSIGDIKELFVQFVAKGQCIDFIKSLGEVNIQLTESNIDSLQQCRKASSQAGAIVPSNSFNQTEFSLTYNKVNDYENNQTRFLALSKNNTLSIDDAANKTSIIVLDDDDHPGLLGEVLLSFSSRLINLTNIISRPTRKIFGKYHFFIEFEGSIKDSKVAAALDEISKTNKVKILGSYKTEQIIDPIENIMD